MPTSYHQFKCTDRTDTPDLFSYLEAVAWPECQIPSNEVTRFLTTAKAQPATEDDHLLYAILDILKLIHSLGGIRAVVAPKASGSWILSDGTAIRGCPDYKNYYLTIDVPDGSELTICLRHEEVDYVEVNDDRAALARPFTSDFEQVAKCLKPTLPRWKALLTCAVTEVFGEEINEAYADYLHDSD